MDTNNIFSQQCFIEKIIELRELNNLTQRDMAKLLHVDRSTYAYYELGKTMPNLNILAQMTYIFHVTADYLLGIDKEEERTSVFELASRLCGIFKNQQLADNGFKNPRPINKLSNKEPKK